ncbi:GDSL-type esterase/lipase family protein, partial [Pedococcus sp. 5OH_020]|uniref:GDSL-type esterase/lipase family protein n=1 Tax=Pedococcus sp. 5OH_020 TaxID=2989814 RepID=UPI0022E9B6ED
MTAASEGRERAQFRTIAPIRTFVVPSVLMFTVQAKAKNRAGMRHLDRASKRPTTWVAAALLVVCQAAIFAPPSVAVGPALSWSMMGDSYSAGVGLGTVTSGCDQDPYAYAPRAQRDILSASYSITQSFVACSGATTSDLWNSQIPTVSSGTNIASLTIGGNDIGFEPKLKGCFYGACGPDTMSLQADVPGGGQTWDDVFNNLVTRYVQVRLRMAAGGHLYVVSYPIPFARQSSSDCEQFTPLEQNAANALVTRLDDTAYLAVQRANSVLQSVHGRLGNTTFVDWRTGTRQSGAYAIPPGYAGAGQQFDSYTTPDGLCNTAGHTPYINRYILSTNYKNSFHPNSTGYWAAAQMVANQIKSDFPTGGGGGGPPSISVSNNNGQMAVQLANFPTGVSYFFCHTGTGYPTGGTVPNHG